MMSVYHYDLFALRFDAYVNPVNTVGIMGKGLALQFKNRFPLNYLAYADAAKVRKVTIGKMFVFETGSRIPRYIVNFPTKEHWRNPSKIEYIEKGLEDLRYVIIEKEIRSIAIPALGCGLGGLNWKDVRELIFEKLEGLDSCVIRVCEPM